MKLRKKTIAIIGLTLLGLIVLLYAFSQIILMGSFTQLEQQSTQRNIERAKNALLDNINRLDSVAGDWASWDETYNFIQNGNEAYIRSNLDPSTLANLKVNYVLFYNTSGHLVHGSGADIEKEQIIQIPGFFQPDLSPNNIILNHSDINSSISGIIILPEGPMLISSKPILKSEHQGPVKGTIIMLNFLDSAEIERLSRITNSSLSLSLFNDPDTSDFRSAIQILSKEKPMLIQPLSNDIIAGYLLLNDIGGTPAVVIETKMPREIHKQGENTMRYLVLSIIGVGLVFGLVTIFLLEKNVLSRLALLNSNMSAIGTSGDHSMRVSMIGNDELSNMAKEINRMLEELEKADEAEKKQLLLKEIYHRVKNNLQIVISLLNLQSQKTNDKNVIEIFRDSQNRIRSMALIHEKLYNSRDLAGINFKEYIHDLTYNLLHSYGVNPGRINLKIDIDEVILNLDTATPCGLIVTELVSNAFKHAFPADRKGDVHIRFFSVNNEKYTMIISDNGIGFPEDIDFRKTTTLGLQLVTSLVGQLDGTIELDKRGGTEFKIEFKEQRTGKGIK
ncbi:MAG: hypothetical protein J5U19_08250 [Candidatus Methanoperedens sp.]|nr:hypothetical protein [Candidatus Methanoperedens sp.]